MVYYKTVFCRTSKKSGVCRVEVTVKILNRTGLHARPAALLAKLANQFECSIRIVGAHAADAKSILDLLTLAAGPGTELQVCASGNDEQAAIQAIQALFAGKFQEE